jgi:UDP-N-acetylglucosamine--N-acetylmuramyl-(pentapeptide) pyrophosphoryl-undecaprenol N-acetylglucosamine transferase
LHDSDAVAGRANRFSSRFARRIAIAYEHARTFFPREKVMLTGNPVRTEILGADPESARAYFQFDAERPLVVVIGGSLGARALNHLIIKALPELLKGGVQVLHVVGEAHLEEVMKLAAANGITQDTTEYRAVAFLNAEDMGKAYAAADVVISRAGAGSITELAACKKASILVPLPTAANDEQRLNAYEVSKNGGAIVLEEANLSENLLMKVLTDLLGSAERREKMGQAIYAFYHPDAAKVIAEGVISMY